MPGLLVPRAQQARLPQDGVPRTPQKHRTGITQTTTGLGGPGYAPLNGAMQAPQQPRTTDPPTVLHIQRLPAGWSCRHLADLSCGWMGRKGWRRLFMEEKTTGT